MRSGRVVWMRSGRIMWMRSSLVVWMRSSRVVWMRSSRVVWMRSSWLECLTANAVVATVLGSIPASSDTVESEGLQISYGT
jgi:hypothetical protein